MSASKKSANKKTDSPPTKKAKKQQADEPTEDVIDPHKEEIERLTREREEIRSKLNTVCSKILENVNPDNYSDEIDFNKQQQPSDIPTEHLLTMIDEICHYRTAFLNLFQEHDDSEKVPIQRKVTQLAIEDPHLFRKRLTSDQRLTFVVRERDLWKENAQLLQIMYATIVDQLEMEIFKKMNIKTNEILQAHRLNLEDVCLIFSSPLIRSIQDAQKLREKDWTEVKKPSSAAIVANFDEESRSSPTTNISNENQNENLAPVEVEERISSSSKNKRMVSFANEVNVFEEKQETNELPIQYEQQQQQPVKEKTNSTKLRLPSAHETLVDKMDSNLRMLIIKELSKDSQISKPPSKMSSTYRPSPRDTNAGNRSRKKLPEWVLLARLIGIDEPEIDHWLSQSLQFPAGRVISTWCNTTTPPPNVAELYSLVQSNELNRLDLARQIETMYNI